MAAGRMQRARGLLILSAIVITISVLTAMIIAADAAPRSLYLVDGVNQAANTTIIWVDRRDLSTPAAPAPVPASPTTSNGTAP